MKPCRSADEIIDRIQHDLEHAESGRGMARMMKDRDAVLRLDGRIDALERLLRECADDTDEKEPTDGR